MSGTLRLAACRPVPLMSYLKGLGAFRILAEQLDERIRCNWRGEALNLETALSEDDVQTFFLHEYRPTPILAPWNRGSGFWDTGSAGQALAALETSTHPRLSAYRKGIETARTLLARHYEGDKAPSGTEKLTLLRHMRNHMDDEFLLWIDALWAIGEGRSRFAPLLGTGGNDGRLDFSANFMQRLADILPLTAAHPAPETSSDWLRHCLFENDDPPLRNVSIGQFDPGAGGANVGQGFDCDSLVNPWDFILMIEGSLLFAGATARRLGQLYRQASFPFTVDSTPAGAGTLASVDRASSRGEIWMPIWNQPLSLQELQYLCAEGRAQVGRRPAQDGAGFALALAGLGIDRGVHAFERFSFLQRNGRAYVASPQGRFYPRLSQRSTLLDDLTYRLRGLISEATKKSAPASLASQIRQLEECIIQFSRAPTGDEPRILQEMLLCVANIELLVHRSKDLRNSFSPLPWLDAQWWEATDDGSLEYALAAAVSAVGGARSGTLREYIAPVTLASRGFTWNNEVYGAWSIGQPLWANLVTILSRRLLAGSEANAQTQSPDTGPIQVSLPVIVAFLQGLCVDEKIQGLVPALTLIRPASYVPRACRPELADRSSVGTIPLVYALSKPLLALHGAGESAFQPHWLPRMAAGQGRGLIAEMTRRLRSMGLGQVVGTYRDIRALDELCPDTEVLRRAGAALIVPLESSALPRTQEGLLERQGNLLRMIAWQTKAIDTTV